MIVSSDKEYIETKLIKQGKKKVKSYFIPMVDWIHQIYKVKPLNIYYNSGKLSHNPVLCVMLEFEQDKKRFLKDSYYPNPEIVENILTQFKFLYVDEGNYKKNFSWINNYQLRGFSLDGLKVGFNDFESTAKDEANHLIPESKIEKLKRDLDIKDLWKIFRFWSETIFFFYTDKQVKEHSEKGIEKYLTDRYFELLKKYDEFDYIKKEEIKIKLDSKENFDNNYKSNWFYYTR